MLTQKEKERVIKKYHLREGDTGSSEVQIALFTEEIKRLTLHLKEHPKDHSSRRGLLKMVAKRKRLLDYLKDTSVRRYNKLAKALKL
ncbi:MAG: 30S ribosomal protein S15 [Candidatus Terrybacteria bacterium RIFCSPLOWO2_01_FULL_58_14]|uniref:Small ribosomal subunit protein uS15 n=2 Tax=Candidatus Terryibacteriota TaxID=1817920 RepID=A0A1G2Q1I8_9BACT|nr:MAG: 30S ribosomal protein S15 [Candidatus Terrybacteria bacterium RIFCSPHIGHO2_01_FULL_58_15]OHA53702.1 MAG: 30S ribosomal protein S15 [Candidatus Terrybacteria bacterium RIFCSPLOWO2_01_FULL_58_14]